MRVDRPVEALIAVELSSEDYEIMNPRGHAFALLGVGRVVIETGRRVVVVWR
jgi:hypothetical protein